MNSCVLIEGDNLSYLQEAAKKRNISATRLSQIIMDVILELKLIDNTLDDEGKVYEQLPRGKWGQGRKTQKTAVVLESRSNLRSTKPAARPSVAYRKPEVPTRAEIRRDFETAVHNTPNVRSEDDIVRMTPDQVRERIKQSRSMSFDEARGLGPVTLANGERVGGERHESAEDMVHSMHTEGDAA